jgi:ubiquitin carboxyl-terminal hydrolase 1
VCHHGQHSFGHYIAYRRKPRRVGGGERWAPPRIVNPIKVEEMMMAGKIEGGGDNDSHGMEMPEYVFEDDPLINPSSGKNRSGWLRISDDSVRECGIESVLQEGSGAFMLYYERAEHARAGGVYPYSSLGSSSSVRTTGSQETLKPEIRTLDLNGSVGSLVSEVGVGIKKEERGLSSSALLVGKEEEEEEKGTKGVRMSSSLVLGTSPSHSQPLGPRVVRSVVAGRARTVEREAGSSVSSSLSSLDSLGSRSFHPSASAQPSSSGVTKSSSLLNNGVTKSPSLPSNGVTTSPSPNNGITKSSSLPTSTQPIPIPIPKNAKKTGPLQMNGRPHFIEEEMGEGMMTASAPSILVNPKATRRRRKCTRRRVRVKQRTSIQRRSLRRLHGYSRPSRFILRLLLGLRRSFLTWSPSIILPTDVLYTSYVLQLTT